MPPSPVGYGALGGMLVHEESHYNHQHEDDPDDAPSLIIEEDEDPLPPWSTFSHPATSPSSLATRRRKEMNHRQRRNSKAYVIGTSFAILFVLMMVGIALRYDKGTPAAFQLHYSSRRYQQINKANFVSASSSIPTIKATNSYTEYDEEGTSPPGSGYPFSSQYVLVEPYRTTTFSILSSPLTDSNEGDSTSRSTITTDSSGYTYTWTFNDDGSSATGRTVTHVFEALGATTIDLAITKTTVSKGKPTTTKISQTSYPVLNRYIRREIRSMSSDDLKAYFDAVYEIYNLKASGGRRLYSDNFRSIQEISAVYNQLSSDETCDHLNDGLGFMTSHAGLLLTFDQAIQAIEPTLTVPYWDFTIDAEDAASNDGMDAFYQSEVFGEAMFGSPKDWKASETSEQGIASGLLTELKIWVNMWDYGLKHSSYGYARSPLNTNPEKYVTRHALSYGMSQSAPGCAEHHDAMQESSLTGLVMKLQSTAYSAIPMAIGGVSNADLSFLESEYGYSHVKDFAKLVYKAQWSLYRKGYLTQQEYCTDSSACKASCSGLDLEETTNEEARTILQEVHPLFMSTSSSTTSSSTTSSSTTIDYALNTAQEDISLTLLKTLCNDFDSLQPAIGDLFDVPTNDPIFWSAIATLDRLWQWKRVTGLADESWPDDACYGHSQSDTLVGIYADSTTGDYLSNQELYEMMGPTSVDSGLTYLYDTFSWMHCADSGIPTDLSPSAATTTISETEVTGMKATTISAEAAARAEKRRARAKARAQFKPKGRTGL